MTVCAVIMLSSLMIITVVIQSLLNYTLLHTYSHRLYRVQTSQGKHENHENVRENESGWKCQGKRKNVREKLRIGNVREK